MKVLEALAAAIAAEGVDHVFAVMGDANQDVIVELCEKHGLKYVMHAFPGDSALQLPRRALATPTQQHRWGVSRWAGLRVLFTS
jgi:hypothetical protein